MGATSWSYRARVDPQSDYRMGVVDGDTYELVIDCGFNIHRRITVRSRYLDTAEIHTVEEGSVEYERGVKQRDFVETWFSEARVMARTDGEFNGEWPLWVYTHKDETGKFGRYIAEVQNVCDTYLHHHVREEFGDGAVYSETQ